MLIFAIRHTYNVCIKAPLIQSGSLRVQAKITGGGVLFGS